MRAVALLLCLLPVMIFAQQYYEASGQTRVFTLAAGAKAGPSALLPGSRIAHFVAPYLLVTMQNGPRISVQGVQGTCRVSIYNVAGKRVQSAEIAGKSTVELRTDLPCGVYFARLEAKGLVMQTARFWKAS